MLTCSVQEGIWWPTAKSQERRNEKIYEEKEIRPSYIRIESDEAKQDLSAAECKQRQNNNVDKPI